MNAYSPPAARTRAGQSAPPDLTQPIVARILIVDDDERNAFAAIQALEDLGHELVVARSGEEALKQLLLHEFAVILLDLHMPGMDGYETAHLIRSRRRTRNIPIVFLTAIFRDEAHIFQAYSAGAVDMVFKPVDPFILRSKVSVLVDLHLKAEELKRQIAHGQWLLEENRRVQVEKDKAEAALRRSRERQEQIMRSLPVTFHSRIAEPPFEPVFISEGVRAITGFSPEEMMSSPTFGASRIHPDDMEKVVAAVSGALETGSYSCEFRWLCADGQYRYLFDQGVLAPGEDSDRKEVFGVILDSTDRRHLEEQLAQARKMEAVGQLTGGVAHDFNNLLTVILGNIDMLSRKAEDEKVRTRRVDAMRLAAEKGRDLTRQLLAFSRRQHLSPVTLDVNALIRDFEGLMQQAVGEAIELQLKLAKGQLCANVDPTQLETALLNLAVNARDAMPDGGPLIIVTKRHGAQIAVEVRDSGVGMSDEVRERVFEPFFTTKDVGKGSGLGLSQVYGFVRQSDGHVEVDSALGSGTTVRLLLPASAENARKPRETVVPSPDAVGGSERLLVVEDDPAVLTLTRDLLRGLGYQVTTATTAAEALAILKKGEPVDLLFSDIVMPGGTSGVNLARQAQELRPGMRVLLTSGFVGDGTGLAEHEYPLLDKPYEGTTLAATIRNMLDQPLKAPETGKPHKRQTAAAAAGGG
ncbi:MAG TPA: response regulator [Caulobacteraceae bacterium]|nr:response regulator [Caulobacteraceae bacterium]